MSAQMKIASHMWKYSIADDGSYSIWADSVVIGRAKDARHARLIAAAPDLAKALRQIAAQSAQDYEDPEQEAYASREIARAALAGL
jgi:hypothetical protein